MFIPESKPDTAKNVHQTVLDLLKGDKPGKILDAAAGEGALTIALMQLGFSVEACDLNPNRFKIGNLKCRKIDLNKSLLYQDESFDFVVCVEVLEHLHDPWFVISEFNRVLKNHGKLIITTPNILSIYSRLLFFFYGDYHHFSNKELHKEPKDLYHELDKHINPISFPELTHILHRKDFCLEKIATNMYQNRELSHRYRLILMGAYPFIKVRMNRRYGPNSLLCSNELLFGDILILKAEKNCLPRFQAPAMSIGKKS